MSRISGGGHTSVSGGGRSAQNPNHGGILSNSSGNRHHQRSDRVRSMPTPVAEDAIQSSIGLLRRSIHEIQHKNNSGLSFEELYRTAYTMVIHKHAEELYSEMQQLMTTFLQNEVRKTVIDSINSGFLKVVNSVWSDHTTSLMMIRDILMYLDRVYVPTIENASTIYDLGIQLFRDEIIAWQPINDHLKATLLGMIANERNNETIEWMDLRNACQMLNTLGLGNRAYYEAEFENMFVNDTIDFYQRASQSFLAENSAEVYVNKVNQVFIDEHDRTERYLDRKTEIRVIEVLNTQLIIANMQTIVEMPNSGLVFMMINDQIDSMRKMHNLFRRVNGGTKQMVAVLSKYLRKRGEELVNQCKPAENSGVVDDNAQQAPQAEPAEENGSNSGVGAGTQLNPLQYIQNLLDLKALFDRYLAQAFDGNKEFEQPIQLEFSRFINLNHVTAEFLSLYIDEKLRKGQKLLNESDMESALEKAMMLFKFIQDKDIFEGFYRKHLAKRLLLSKSDNEDLEKAMISKLKTECGTQFTNKLEAMFRDIELANNMISEYKEQCEKNRPDVEITVRVLSQNSWPIAGSSSTPPCILPMGVNQSFQHFQNFYIGKHTGRRIVLNAQLGNSDVKATFYGAAQSQDAGQPESSKKTPKLRGETKILQVTTYQMIVLLCFNYHDQLTFAQLFAETQIPERDLKRSLQSLAMSKPTQRILCRQGGASQEIEKTDVFTVNDNFTSKLTRIKILPVSMGRTATEQNQQEQQETRNKVEDDRKHEIEAAIVRVLKARKTILHNDLITEVTNQLKHRFMPNPTMIKKRIETLIEREYLKRDSNNNRQYNYIA